MTTSLPTDLWIAMAIVGGLSVAVGTLGWLSGRKLDKWGKAVIAVGLMAATAGYLYWGRDATFWTTLLPFSGVIILTNPTPWLASAMAGMCLAQPSLPIWRRSVLALTLVMAGFYIPVQLLFVKPPPTVPTWIDGVAMQSSSATCSPAAAATLLKTKGIEANERDMAVLCLTNPKGTPLLGLYRGLALIGPQHNLHPSLTTQTLAELQQRPDLLPAVVSVQLTAEVDARDPRYRENWGWVLGTRHSVTFLAFDGPNHVWVADPGVGKERWRLSHISDLWVGDVLSLVPADE
ncbi:MAG: hypothetical protein AAGA25_17065 [Planctomycetota bacterium]